MSGTWYRFFVALGVVLVICAVIAGVISWNNEQGIRDTCRMRGYYDAEWAGGPRWNGAWYCVKLHPLELEEAR